MTIYEASPLSSSADDWAGKIAIQPDLTSFLVSDGIGTT